MARLQSVCKQMNNKKDTFERVAHAEYLRAVPEFAHLPDSLLQQHIEYTDMRSANWTYLYHLALCYPTVQEICSRQRRYFKTTTDWKDISHNWHFTEKLFGKGNV